MHFLAEILIERRALTKAGFLISGEAVLIPKARRRAGLVLVVPIVRHLLIMLAELDVVISLTTILGKRSDSACQNQHRKYIKGSFHKFAGRVLSPSGLLRPASCYQNKSPLVG